MLLILLLDGNGKYGTGQVKGNIQCHRDYVEFLKHETTFGKAAAIETEVFEFELVYCHLLALKYIVLTYATPFDFGKCSRGTQL